MLIKWYSIGIWFPKNYPECTKVLQIYAGDMDNINDNLILPGGFVKKKFRKFGVQIHTMIRSHVTETISFLASTNG